MQEIFRITNELRKADAIALIRTTVIDKPIIVEISYEEPDRSLAQNRLYRLWCAHISKISGENLNDLYSRYRGSLLIPIYERDKVKNYAGVMQSLRDLWGVDELKAKQFHAFTVEQSTTKDANMKQFSEYLTRIEEDAMSQNIPLPYPDLREMAIKKAA